jgi:hypothetical protein
MKRKRTGGRRSERTERGEEHWAEEGKNSGKENSMKDDKETEYKRLRTVGL